MNHSLRFDKHYVFIEETSNDIKVDFCNLDNELEFSLDLKILSRMNEYKLIQICDGDYSLENYDCFYHLLKFLFEDLFCLKIVVETNKNEFLNLLIELHFIKDIDKFKITKVIYKEKYI
ncbi:MAG: hypothetical protein ACRC5M_01800 [Anaeroplasmataceae bacterium]